MTLVRNIKTQLQLLINHLDTYSDTIKMKQFFDGITVPQLKMEKQSQKQCLDTLLKMRENRTKYAEDTQRMRNEIPNIQKQLDEMDVKDDEYTKFIKENIFAVGIDISSIDQDFKNYIQQVLQEKSDNAQEMQKFIKAVFDIFHQTAFSKEFIEVIGVPHYAESMIASDRQAPSADYRVHIGNKIATQNQTGVGVDQDQQNQVFESFMETANQKLESWKEENKQLYDQLEIETFDIEMSTQAFSFPDGIEKDKLFVFILRTLFELLTGLSEYFMENAGQDSADGVVIIGQFVKFIPDGHDANKPICVGWYM